jgi:hypothetical protein
MDEEQTVSVPSSVETVTEEGTVRKKVSVEQTANCTREARRKRDSPGAWDRNQDSQEVAEARAAATEEASAGTVLDAHEEFLRGRAPQVGFNGSVLFRELQRVGYAGSYQSLIEFIGPRWGVARNVEATQRFETLLGEQSQVDWGSIWVWLEEVRVRVHLFVMVLSYRDGSLRRDTVTNGSIRCWDGHASAFAAVRR